MLQLVSALNYKAWVKAMAADAERYEPKKQAAKKRVDMGFHQRQMIAAARRAMMSLRGWEKVEVVQ